MASAQTPRFTVNDFKDVLGCPVSFSSPARFSVAMPIQFEAFCCRFFTLQSRTGVQAYEGPRALGSLGGARECRPPNTSRRQPRRSLLLQKPKHPVVY